MSPEAKSGNLDFAPRITFWTNMKIRAGLRNDQRADREPSQKECFYDGSGGEILHKGHLHIFINLKIITSLCWIKFISLALPRNSSIITRKEKQFLGKDGN